MFHLHFALVVEADMGVAARLGDVDLVATKFEVNTSARSRFVEKCAAQMEAVQIAENTDCVIESADSCFKFGSLNPAYGDCQSSLDGPHRTGPLPNASSLLLNGMP